MICFKTVDLNFIFLVEINAKIISAFCCKIKLSFNLNSEINLRVILIEEICEKIDESNT